MIRRSMRYGVTALLAVLWCVSVAASPHPFAGAIEQANIVGTLRLQGELFHVQGLDFEGRHVWVTSVDQVHHRGYLHEFDRETGQFLRRIDLTDGMRYHLGGMSISGRSIWVPVAEYRPNSSAVIMEIDADSLQVRRRIKVPDHLGCIAASATSLVAGNWDSKLLYIFDLRDPDHYRVVHNPSPTHYQDMKFSNGQLVAGGSLTWMSGSVDWIDWPSMKIRRTLQAGPIGPMKPFGHGGPMTAEGMAIEGRELYFMPEDGPSRVFHFELNS